MFYPYPSLAWRFLSPSPPLQVLTCYNDQQVNVEDIHLTREMIEQYQQQQAATLNVSSWVLKLKRFQELDPNWSIVIYWYSKELRWIELCWIDLNSVLLFCQEA